MSDRRWSWPFVIGVNVVAGAAAWVAAVPAAPAVARMLGAALLVLVIPGLGWLGLARRRELDLPRLSLAVVGLSSVACVGGAALLAITVGEPSRALFLVWIAIVTNAGFAAAGTPGTLDRRTPWSFLAIVGAVAFVVSSTAATKLVPPLEDHDMEVRGTAYGLVSDFKPYFQTNREVYLPMAHPPLFHFHVAESLVLTAEIDAVRPSYESALRAERAQASGESLDWMDQWREDHRAFVERPALAGTRAPNALFFALVVALLGDVVVRLTRSRVAGVAAAALYVTFPETLVRGAYAGYFSVTVFAMLTVAMLFDSERGADPGGTRNLGWLAVGGAFAALVDHKTVVLILAVTLVAALQFLWDSVRLGSPRSLSRLVSIVDKKTIALGVGFSLATFAWWGYGLLVDSATFVRDHLRMHIAHRFLLNDIRLAHDSTRYAPSMMELWAELAAHTGYLFVPVAVVGIGLWIARRKRLDMVAVLAAWFLVGSVLYTLTDWRQTKHMMNQVAPAVAAAVVLVWPRRETDEDGEGASSRWSVAGRAVAGGALVVALGLNLLADARLVEDFRSLTISGASDVDGW